MHLKLSLTMKKLFFIFFTLIVSQETTAQCWKRLGEAQDTTYVVSYMIEDNGSLYKLEPDQNWSSTILTQVFTSDTDWERVFYGNSIAMAIKSDSTLWGWGNNYYNELLISGPQNSPIQIGSDKWIDLSFDNGNVCGIKSDGSLWIWGMDIGTPIQYGTANDWKNIEIRGYFSWSNIYDGIISGIKNDGSLWYSNYSTSPIFNQIGSGQTWIFSDISYNSLYAINSNNELFFWSNLSNPPVLVNSSIGWKEVSCTGNLQYNSGLKLDGTIYHWDVYSLNPIPSQISSTANMSEIDNNGLGILALNNIQLYRFEDEIWTSGTFTQTNIGDSCCAVSNVENIITCDLYNWNGNNIITSGTYTAYFTNSLGCDSIVTINLTINNLPENPSITEINNSTLTTQNQLNCNYQWVTCPGYAPITGANNSSFSVISSGEYAVIVTNECGSDTSECYNVSISSIQELTGDFLAVYPNPTLENITVEVSEGLYGKELFIQDFSGRVVLSHKITASKNELFLSSLTSGSYYLIVEGYPIVKKIIKN